MTADPPMFLRAPSGAPTLKINHVGGQVLEISRSGTVSFPRGPVAAVVGFHAEHIDYYRPILRMALRLAQFDKKARSCQ